MEQPFTIQQLPFTCTVKSVFYLDQARPRRPSMTINALPIPSLGLPTHQVRILRELTKSFPNFYVLIQFGGSSVCKNSLFISNYRVVMMKKDLVEKLSIHEEIPTVKV